MRLLIGFLRMYLLRTRGLPATGRARLVGARPRLDIRGEVTGCRHLWIRGDQLPVQITVRTNAKLHLGEKVFLNQGVNILCATSVSIGDDCKIGDFAAIRDTDTHRVDPSSPVNTGAVTIGRNVWLGRGVLVMPGVSIGDNAVVGAGALVTKDLPPNSVAVGVPAQVVKIFPEPPPGWTRD